MAGLLYKESNGFTDFDQVQKNIDSEEYIDFNELLPEQEKVFQMIRSCLWEGDAQPELLNVVGLNKVLTTQQDASRRLVVSINRRLWITHQTSLPDSVTPEAIAALSWGPSLTNEASKQKIEKMLIDLNSFTAERNFGIYASFSSLGHHLGAFAALLNFGKCSRIQSMYQNDIRERLCHNFVPNLHALSCSFGLLTLGTMMLFLLSFCAGHRVLARLESLEYSDYLNKRRQEDEEEAKQQLEEVDSCCKSSPSSVEDPNQSLMIFVEEKTMPVYDQQSHVAPILVASVVQEQNQVLDLVYIPPPMYLYGNPDPQQQ